MKKQLVLAAGLAVLATPALASKARLQALGEDTNGSFYINDNRNIFLNASEVLNHKDMVTFEWGSSRAGGTGSTNQTDVVGDSNAEGGFLRSSGNLVWGAQMGRVTDFAADHEAAAARGAITAPNRYAPNNALDLFIGGDAGVKWGVQATYISREDDTFTATAGDAEAKEISLAAGVTAGNISGYLKYGITGEVETKANDWEAKRKSPLELGVSYKWMEYTFFGQYEMHGMDVELGAADSDVKDNRWQIGAGRSTKLSDKATLYTKIAYVNRNVDWDDAAAAEEDGSSKTLPVTIGLEYDAASWLALRGSISQAIFINEADDGDDKTTATSTNVNAGASLKFGDLSVDGVLGTGVATNDTTETGVFNTDNLMSRVSMTYRF